ncbi:MAG: hypothetical protein HC877_19550 [Thioploca sp.]|nr:hypothetical protein [Thioploca sp.]
MYQYDIKSLVISGLVLYFTLNNLQAATLFYPGLDTQGNPITSQITVTEQIGNLFFLQIEGGMPDINSQNQEPYLRVLRFTKPTKSQAHAIFSDPFLYIFVPAQVSYHKLVVDVNEIYVFLRKDQNQFQLDHLFREGIFCDAQPCTSEEEAGLFCGESVCQLKSETTSFNMPIVYTYE